MNKRIGVALVLGMAVLMGAVVSHVRADEAKKAAAQQKWFEVESKHTGAGCLTALDELNAKKLLGKTYFGCMTGDHRGWTLIQAPSKDAAMNMFPATARPDLKIVEVSQFTAQDLKQIHAQHS